MSATATNPAEIYDAFMVPALFRPWADELLRRVPARPGARVLDIACGTGAVTRKVAPLAGPGDDVTGLDISPPMLEVARSKPAPDGAPVRWVEGSADALPFEDGSFDVALCQQGLQFLTDRAAAVREMRRVLRAGGLVGLSIWREAAHQGLLGAMSDALDRHFGKPPNDPISMGDPDEVHSLFAHAGFRDITVEPVRRRVRFPSADPVVRMTVMSAAAVIPKLAEASDEARDAAIEAIREDVQDTIASTRDGEGVAFSMESHIVTAAA